MKHVNHLEKIEETKLNFKDVQEKQEYERTKKQAF